MDVPKKISTGESVALMATLMSLVALAIDAMLPALPDIGQSFGVNNPNDNQMIVTSIFLGMSLGLFLYGPLSDSFGRIPSICGGIVIFVIGCLVSVFATSFEILLAGRVLQGFGAASTRVVTIAMIRDQFKGREMARIMSLIMMIFILVPALAPSLGQMVLLFGGWKYIFGLLIGLAVIGFVWLLARQQETLLKKNRLPFSLKQIGSGAVETLTNPTALGYTIASGLVFGAFIGYLSTSQQILQVQYSLGDRFPIYFGSIALSVGFASFVNSRLVMRLGMYPLCFFSLLTIFVTSLIYVAYASAFGGHPPLPSLVVYLLLTFFCFGLLFGNFNALAIEPLGHIAGIATAVIGCVQTTLSVAISFYIGSLYNNSILPLITGFCLLAVASLVSIWFTNKYGKALSY